MTGLEYALLFATIASFILHAVALKTKNPYDDVAADAIDFARAELEKRKADEKAKAAK